MSNETTPAIQQPGLESLSKSFEPAALEAHWGPEWEKRGYGVAGHRGTQAPRADAPSFAIQLPPPNVTGTLHMGHAFNQTIMDSLTRYHRMMGFNTAWIPGTDHAGIATQIVVERQLQGQGISRHDMGPTPFEARKNFVSKIWEWKEQSGNTITEQMRRMGDSVDWTREYFTMDDKLSIVVSETFVKLYEQGLIYRGKRLVSWDPVLQSAVSDLEVENIEADGKMHYILYPFADGPQLIDGVMQSQKPGGLLHHAFSARSLALFEKLNPAQSSSYISGLLIGEEIKSAKDERTDKLENQAPLFILGNGQLTQRYSFAMEALGLSATALADEVTWTGLWALAQHLYPQHFKLS